MNCRDYCETSMRGSRSTPRGIRNSPAKERGAHSRRSLSGPAPGKAGPDFSKSDLLAHSAGMLRASLPQEPEAVRPVEAVPRAKPSAPLAPEGTA